VRIDGAGEYDKPPEPGTYLARRGWRASVQGLTAGIAGLVLVSVIGWQIMQGKVDGNRTFGLILIMIMSAGILLALTDSVRRIVRREVALAVDSDGVYLGRQTGYEAAVATRVPWSEVATIVLYEQEFRRRTSTAVRRSTWVPCIGVALPADSPNRAIGTATDPRTGEPLASKQRELVQSYMDEVLAGLAPDWIGPSRVIVDWRLDRAALADAVRTFAPSVPIIDGGRRNTPSPAALVRAWTALFWPR
jgi:hypothetical protein